MNGNEAVPGLRCTRVPCDDPEIAVFGISGSLGPGAKPMLERLFDRCMQYQMRRVVLDLSALDSLGGGGARLMSQFATQRRERDWETVYIVTSPTLRQFLNLDPRLEPPVLAENLEAALDILGAEGPEPGHRPSSPAAHPVEAARKNAHGWGAASKEASVAVELDEEQDLLAQADPDSQEFHGEPETPWVFRAHGDDAEGFEDLALRWRQCLAESGLASKVHVFALQPDGVYHPLTIAGIDLERGLPYHGLLASRVRAQSGPGFLFDLCIDPLPEEEHDILASMECEVVARTGGGEDPELLLFLAKGKPGDEYSLEELQALQELLDAGLPPTEARVDESVGATPPDPSPSLAEEAPTAWSEQGDGNEVDPMEGAPVARVDPQVGELRLRAPANLLGEPAYRESERERLLRRKLTQFRDILGLSRDFEASFGTARILEVMVLSVVSLARTDTVLFLSERDGEFHLSHHRGLDRSALAEMALRVDSTIVQAALQTRAPLRIEEAENISEEEKIWARQHRFPHVVPFHSQDRVLGVLFLGESHQGDVDLEMLTFLLQEAALAYERALLFETLQDHTLGVVRGLVTLIESCSGQDASATERVVRYTQALAQELQFPEALRRDLIYGAVLRDVGMLRIDPAILRTGGQLTPQQWDLVRRHPVDGAAIVRQMRFGDAAVEVVMHHHEAYNGEGYPGGLRGRAIPLGARIVSVAESYVKMTLDRPYRKALGRVEALESLAENWGLRYDPLVVDALVRVVNRELTIGLEGETEFARDLFGV